VVCYPHLCNKPGKSQPSSGVLSCPHGYMNIALEQTEEHVFGTVTNRYGDVFIHGNSGPMTSLALLLLDALCTVLFISGTEPL
jgi:hypothetical protein